MAASVTFTEVGALVRMSSAAARASGLSWAARAATIASASSPR
ncbi:Uncharacterised protein [Mycobacteroides abscessus subsp. abscessus]|nr:Uncharacterised protein [Mycobacteroides abscessus subsp. abscessus]